MVFLERDIKARKQAFGIEIFDLLKSSDSSATASAAEIQKAYEVCQQDIEHLEAKVNSKQREMEAIDHSAVGGGAGNVIADDAETPGIQGE